MPDQVTLASGDQIMASVVGVDPDKDVAVLKIKPDEKVPDMGMTGRW